MKDNTSEIFTTTEPIDNSRLDDIVDYTAYISALLKKNINQWQDQDESPKVDGFTQKEMVVYHGFRRILEGVAKKIGFDLDDPLSPSQRNTNALAQTLFGPIFSIINPTLEKSLKDRIEENANTSYLTVLTQAISNQGVYQSIDNIPPEKQTEILISRMHKNRVFIVQEPTDGEFRTHRLSITDKLLHDITQAEGEAINILKKPVENHIIAGRIADSATSPDKVPFTQQALRQILDGNF